MMFIVRTVSNFSFKSIYSISKLQPKLTLLSHIKQKLQQVPKSTSDLIFLVLNIYQYLHYMT